MDGYPGAECVILSNGQMARFARVVRCERSNEVRGQEHAPRRIQVPPLFEKALFVYPNEHLI